MAKHVDFDGTGRLSHARQALTDLDVQILIRPDDLTPSALQILIGEYLTTGNKRGWHVQFLTTGVIRLRWSTDGTSTSFADSTVALTTVYADGDKFWLRVVLDVNVGGTNKEARFYTSDDGVTWTQLGASVNTAGTTSIFSDAANVITMAGEGTAATYTGKVYEVRLYSTIDGTTNLVDPEPWDWSTATYGASGVTTVTPAITATEQDVWPARVLLTGSDLEEDDTVTFYRSVAGARTVVRGAEDVVPGDPSLVRVDAEQPFGVPVSYVMQLNGEEEYTDGPDTYTLVGGKIALTDAISGASAEVEILEPPEKRTERPSSVFHVGGRNVAVLGLRPGWVGTLVLEIETQSSADNLSDLLNNATSGVVQVRQGGTIGGLDCYVAVLGDTEVRRDVTDGTDELRIWSLDVIQVEPWAADVEAAGFTLQDIADAYPDPLTLDDLSDDYATLLALAQGDFS
jgi:hypothetical protein